jgi:hypothetical protein
MATAASALIGIAMLLGAVYKRNRLRLSMDWTQGSGIIRKVEVIRDPGPDSNGYFVNVAYDYSVGGANYQGKNIGLSRRAFVRKKSAQAVADRYPVNSPVAVFYDPEKPSDCILVREAPDTIVMTVSGIGLLGLAIVILLYQA